MTELHGLGLGLLVGNIVAVILMASYCLSARNQVKQAQRITKDTRHLIAQLHKKQRGGIR